MSLVEQLTYSVSHITEVNIDAEDYPEDLLEILAEKIDTHLYPYGVTTIFTRGGPAHSAYITVAGTNDDLLDDVIAVLNLIEKANDDEND